MIFGMNKFLFEEAASGEEPAGGGASDAQANEGVDNGDILGKAPEKKEALPEHAGTVEDGWLKGVANEWAKDSSMLNIKSIEDLAKGYVHAQKLIGKDKIVKPSEFATDEEKLAFMHQLGLPKTADEYGITHHEDNAVSEEFTKEFVAKAHEAGVMPEAATKMLAWYNEKKTAEDTAAIEADNARVEQTVADLKLQYGQAFETKVALANTVLSKVASEEAMGSMRESGLLNDKNFITTMVKVAEMMSSEAKFDVNPAADGRLTPTEAKEKITQIQGDLAHPYHNKAHPGHELAVKKMTELFEFVG